MDEEKLKKIIEKLDKETEGMTDEERETHYRSYLMEYMARATISDSKQGCVSRKVSIFKSEHPEWSQAKIVAAAINYCKIHDSILLKDEIGEVASDLGKAGTSEGVANEVGHSANISLRNFSSLIQVIKSATPLKVKHMALGPFRIHLPQKNLNKLQTKLERMTTAEAKNLTAEQFAARAAYARFMKKDSEDIIIGEINEEIQRIIDSNGDKTDDEKEDLIFDYISNPFESKRWFDAEGMVQVEKVNNGLNNIIKAPIILAREIIQEYKFQDVNGDIRIERHFKPYSELKMAICSLDSLAMIVEHQDSWTLDDTVGCVRQLYANDKGKYIGGMGYFVESKLPITIKNALKEGKQIQVSIGFMAELGGSGTYEGQEYDYTQRDIILDHLAICVDSIARCELPKCGVNVEKENKNDSQKFTIISKPDYYYNIDKNIIYKNIEEKSIGDSMKDSLPDPKSGELAGQTQGLPEDEIMNIFMTKFRALLHGNINPEDWTDYGDEIVSAAKKIFNGAHYMDGENKNAIAAKDEEIKKLQDAIKKFEEDKRQDKIKEIKSFTVKFSDADLEAKGMAELTIIADTVSMFAPSMEKPPVIPIKERDTKEELEDASTEREDPRYIFADTAEKFNMSGFVI